MYTTEPGPDQVHETAPPLLLEHVFDHPTSVLDLVVRHEPYWNQSRYQPAAPRAAAATTPAGHPFAMAGGSPPLFRGNWADTSMVVEGATPLFDDPVLHHAARSLFGGIISVPSFLYVNVTAPMPGIDAGHVDVPSFRGLDRRAVPGWLLLAMQRSGLFARWAVRTATAVVWFYDGPGGELSYWPTGPAGPPLSVPPTTNTAIVGDNDRMFHRVEAVGDPGRWRPVARDATLHYAGQDRWELREGTEVVEAYRFGELRVSLSWKAEVFADDAEHRHRASHTDDLTAERALSVMAAALGEKGMWDGRPVDVANPAWVEAVMVTYPRPAAPGLTTL
jgi:hypothetical protein